VCDAESFFGKVRSNFRLWMMFLLGKHAMFGHDPDVFALDDCDSLPLCGKRHAAMVEPSATEITDKFFRLLLSAGGRRVFCAFHAEFLSEGRFTLRLHDFTRSAADAPSSDSPYRLLAQCALSG